MNILVSIFVVIAAVLVAQAASASPAGPAVGWATSKAGLGRMPLSTMPTVAPQAQK